MFAIKSLPKLICALLGITTVVVGMNDGSVRGTSLASSSVAIPSAERKLSECPQDKSLPATVTIDGEDLLHPVALCDFLVAYNRLGRNEHNNVSSPLDWKMLCDDFEPLDQHLCPMGRHLEGICSHRKPHLNPSVRVNFCSPIFSLLTEEQGRSQCTRMCINYVSEARGGCCDIACP
ncbi:expressed unknown protein [Seminavis robusta]|uniref:Secreted protein n=1 Tax=Seminavis robusta TaxID=568900 RepID=A0A9N8DB24_9STRA|nr:expressed unknown protein [Seminavis robusta]|eukprot:Sro67_g037750.1 n/a (177) ;mRNA; f:111087-111698